MTWVLLDLLTGEEVSFERFSDCFPGRDGPLDVEVGDIMYELPLMERHLVDRGLNK